MTKLNNRITIEDLRKEVESIGYYATDKLLYDAYNALALFQDNQVNPGQDIFALCLEGPPGAGKTEFARSYQKLAAKILGCEVKLIDYQCDSTTGKTELYEDINISAAIRNDPDHVNIPGVIIRAVEAVNAGKKVILFIDEYDKAREETDSFFLNFLQSGEINSTQHGDLAIRDEFKGNLQVVLCKNDMREELSGPLSRRIRIIRLDYMAPNTFYKVANRKLMKDAEEPVNDGLLNLVSLMYEKAYENKDLFNRLPSCSEMLIAIEDSDRLLKINAPQSIIYDVIVENMFKSPDDIKTFESVLDKKGKTDNAKLSSLIRDMKSSVVAKSDTPDLNSLIAQKVFTGEGAKLAQSAKEFQNLIDEYKRKFSEMEADRKATIESEIAKIQLENGQLVSSETMTIAGSLFSDESSRIKRGHNIFSISNNDWTKVAIVRRPGLALDNLVTSLLGNLDPLDIEMYENGIVLNAVGEHKLIATFQFAPDGVPQFDFYSTMPVMISTFVKDIINFSKIIDECYHKQYKPKEKTGNAQLDIDTLIYNDGDLPLDSEGDGVYHFLYNDNIKDRDKLVAKLKCASPDNATNASVRILAKKGSSKVIGS